MKTLNELLFLCTTDAFEAVQDEYNAISKARAREICTQRHGKEIQYKDMEAVEYFEIRGLGDAYASGWLISNLSEALERIKDLEKQIEKSEIR